MYEDLQFPIDISGVQNDHPFLDADSLQSLFRRLTALKSTRLYFDLVVVVVFARHSCFEFIYEVQDRFLNSLSSRLQTHAKAYR
ncbi:hypothetical protein RR48_08715 [Papilio machaon]|uniref:Uncharacterized protein n=1 Tax=Papilio machaon TaxID=76193 RepID=A0A194RDB3_PAPMA|nr:hypothetical protein RR48_08715 [Papilio machaon]